VGICDTSLANLTLDGQRNEKNQIVIPSTTSLGNSEESTFFWTMIDDISIEKRSIPFKISEIPSLLSKYNLLTTEDVFLAAVAATGGKTSLMWSYARYFKVFARMSPQGKANIIKSIQDTDKDFHVFMCGDGGNDVGALKQVRILLLALWVVILLFFFASPSSFELLIFLLLPCFLCFFAFTLLLSLLSSC
jgi:hypothetical protein